MPQRDCILLDEDPTEGLAFPLRLLGFFVRKGFPGLHRVYALRSELVS